MEEQREYLYFKDRNELNSRLLPSLKHNLGYNVFISSESDLEKDEDFILLGASIMDIIDDSKTDERILRFARFDSISAAEIRKEQTAYRVILPYTDEIAKEVLNRQSKLIGNVEKTLLSDIYSKLAQITQIQNSLNPIGTILNDLRINNESSIEKLTRDRDEKRVVKYLEFLKSINLVELDNGKIDQGAQFMEFNKQLKNKSLKELYDRLLTYVLQTGTDYLRDYLNLTSLTTYIRWTTSYYLPSSEVGNLLSFSHNALMQNRSNIYRERYLSEVKASSQITNLVHADILEEDGKYLVGKENILKNTESVVHKLS